MTPTPSPSPSPSPSPLTAIGTVTVVSGAPQVLHRSPQAASVLDGRQLRAATAPSLDGALRALPGVDRNRSNAPFTNYGQLRLSFAGAGSDRGSLLLDGIPAQDGFGGQVDWNAIPAAGLARGELLRGPGSALYGSGAIGGVLALSSLAPDTRAGGFLDLSAGGVTRENVTFASTGAIGPFASAITLATRRLGYGVIPPAQASPVDHVAISNADVAQVRLRRSGPRASLDLGALESDDAQDDGRTNDGFSRSLREAYATWSGGEAALLSVTAFLRSTAVVNLADKPAAPGALLYTQHVPTSDAGVRLRWSRAAGGGDLALVAERRSVTGRSDQLTAANAVQSDVSGTQRLDGLALQRTWDGRIGAIAGVRYDAIATNALGERHAAALSPRVALRVDASPATSLRAAFGTGVRAPYLNELIRSFRIGPVLQQNNPALVPERSRSAQIGIDVANAAGRFALDYTATRVTDAIGFATIAANVQQRRNFGRTATDAYTAEYARRTLCGSLRAFATSQHDRVVAGGRTQIGKRLAYVPDAAASLDAERTVGIVTGGLEVAYTGPTFADDLERQPLGATMLIGGRLSMRTGGGTTMTLALDNLADARYLTSLDRLGPPSSLTLRLSIPLGARTAPAPAGC
ncbi:receptor [Vulcanimicrobium alpinum]|uniref:Receptor n=1 Tax=Vulcanimicrobium alpinum TaxID=3016050 RepID=A0AAN1XRZ7_UNVUL|nr:receptor [Vulcanimicrobium alpinum]